ncbi:TPA_asm: traF protein [Salmonella enterica subsp. enterica serovar Typhimurium]|nr:traF protein [Salmonella enterica subsp. enterica serovar Typhimurium]
MQNGKQYAPPLIIASALLISACSHTPNPVQKKGGWFELNTAIEQIKAGDY